MSALRLATCSPARSIKTSAAVVQVTGLAAPDRCLAPSFRPEPRSALPSKTWRASSVATA
jgi:hypothetical protein